MDYLKQALALVEELLGAALASQDKTFYHLLSRVRFLLAQAIFSLSSDHK